MEINWNGQSRGQSRRFSGSCTSPFCNKGPEGVGEVRSKSKSKAKAKSKARLRLRLRLKLRLKAKINIDSHASSHGVGSADLCHRIYIFYLY